MVLQPKTEAEEVEILRYSLIGAGGGDKKKKIIMWMEWVGKKMKRKKLCVTEFGDQETRGGHRWFVSSGLTRWCTMGSTPIL